MNKRLLEAQLKEKKCSKEEILNLRNGMGWSFIYKDLTPNDPRAIETGKILLEKGAVIGSHKHLRDSEVYEVLAGAVEINGKVYCVGETSICECGKSHNAINRFDGESIIGFSKFI